MHGRGEGEGVTGGAGWRASRPLGTWRTLEASLNFHHYQWCLMYVKADNVKDAVGGIKDRQWQ